VHTRAADAGAVRGAPIQRDGAELRSTPAKRAAARPASDGASDNDSNADTERTGGGGGARVGKARRRALYKLADRHGRGAATSRTAAAADGAAAAPGGAASTPNEPYVLSSGRVLELPDAA
jgi:hypothetical protein